MVDMIVFPSVVLKGDTYKSTLSLSAKINGT